jgi:uncharacterized protein YceK
MRRSSRLVTVLAVLAIAASLAGCASAAHHADAGPSSAPATSAPPALRPPANAVVCRKFEKISAALSGVLAAVEADPGATTADGAAKTLSRAAKLFLTWAASANVGSGQRVSYLPLDLTDASLGLSLVAAALRQREAGAVSDAQKAATSVQGVSGDCATVLGN